MRHSHWFSYTLLLAGVLASDQLTKWWALTTLPAGMQRVWLFDFSLAWNYGVSWGLFNTQDSGPGSRLLLLSIILIIVGFSWYAWCQLQEGKHIFAHLCVLGGAVSNLIDRLAYGAVIDFMHLHIGSLYWPTIFNVADLWIIGGIAWLLIETLRDS